MLNPKQLEERSDDGTLYDALRRNLTEVTDELETGEPIDHEKEVEWLAGIAGTLGFVIIDIAESLDRIADTMDPD